MKIVIVGAGGLGCKFGAMLGEHANVWLAHHRKEHADKINDQGVKIKKNGQNEVVKVNATAKPAKAGVADLIIILVKSYDTETATKSILPIIGENTLVITMQNGLGNLEKITEIVGSEHALLGVTFHGATLISPGYTEDKGTGQTYLAYTPTTKKHVEKIAILFNQAGIKTEVVYNVNSMLWAKLCVTAGINSVASVLQVSNGILGSVPEARKISIAAINETIKIAKQKGITLAFDPIKRFEMVTEATSNMYSGTLLDVLKGKRSEIDAISGGIVAEGKKLGISTPTHEMLWDIVKALEATYEFRITKEDISA